MEQVSAQLKQAAAVIYIRAANVVEIVQFHFCCHAISVVVTEELGLTKTNYREVQMVEANKVGMSLKPCPFCGKHPVIENGLGHETWVVCKTPLCANEDNSVVNDKTWNTRSIAPEGTSEDEKKLRNALKIERQEDIDDAVDRGQSENHREEYWDEIDHAFNRLMSRPKSEIDDAPIIKDARDFAKYVVNSFCDVDGEEWADFVGVIEKELQKLLLSRAANAGIPEGWQPIETAPKDDRRIIVFRPTSTHQPKIGEDYWDKDLSGGCWARSNYHHQPTHWMPLPQPPATTGEGEK